MIRGVDVSEYQAGLSLAVCRLAGARFVIARATRGPDLYKDPEYGRFKSEARRLRMPFAAYHFMGGRPPSQEADLIVDAMGGNLRVPVMLDLEPSEKWGTAPTYGQALRLRDAVEGRGLRVRLLYLPHWYWTQIGRPDLSKDGWGGLVSSNYVGNNTRGALADGPDGDRGWEPYGGVTPLIWQWTSSAVLPGYNANTVDGDAYAGTLAQLHRADVLRWWADDPSTVDGMATTVNGWPVLESRTSGPLPRLRKIVLPGTDRHFVIRDGSAGFLLAHVALWWHDEVEPLSGGVWDEWGYAARPVRGSSTGYSQHAGGVAIDLNATKHPLGVAIGRTFLNKQVRQIRRRMRLYEGVLRWGGEWERPDGMHIETAPGTTVKDTERVARKLLDSPRGKRILDANPGLREVILS